MNLSRSRSCKTRAAKTQTNAGEDRSVVNKGRDLQFLDVSCEVKSQQPPFSFRKRSATPDFGLSEACSSDASKPIYRLPLDVFLESKPVSSLSSIQNSPESPRPLILQEESKDIIGLLQAAGAGETSLRLSPVAKRKTYSKLDESSVVDPSTHILVEGDYGTQVGKWVKKEVGKLTETVLENRQGMIQMMRRQADLYEGKMTHLKTLLTTQSAKYAESISSLQLQIRRFRSNRPSSTNKENHHPTLLSDYQQGLRSQEKVQEAVGNQRLSNAKEEYEDRLKQQQKELRTMKQQNTQLRSRLDDAVARAAVSMGDALTSSEEKAVEALKAENRILRSELAEITRNLLCPRCSSLSALES